MGKSIRPKWVKVSYRRNGAVDKTATSAFPGQHEYLQIVLKRHGRLLRIQTKSENLPQSFNVRYIPERRHGVGKTAIHITICGWSGMISLKFHWWSLRAGLRSIVLVERKISNMLMFVLAQTELNFMCYAYHDFRFKIEFRLCSFFIQFHGWPLLFFQL